MEFRVFDLPTENADRNVIEQRWCEINARIRNGDELDRVELDWFDTANTWLMTAEG